MRCRIILKLPSGSYKIASIYFSDYEPSFYIDFPYIIKKPAHFLAAKLKSFDGGNNLVYLRKNCFFFDKSPKFSYHLSGQAHIKDSRGTPISGLKLNVIKLDDRQPSSFLDLVIKNPNQCKPFNLSKDIGDDDTKNLIIDSEGFESDAIELRGVRVAFTKDNPWFNEVKPNHPIIGSKVDPMTNEFIPVFLLFSAYE